MVFQAPSPPNRCVIVVRLAFVDPAQNTITDGCLQSAPTSRPSHDVRNGRVAREVPVASALLIRQELAQKLSFRVLSAILGRKHMLSLGREPPIASEAIIDALRLARKS